MTVQMLKDAVTMSGDVSWCSSIAAKVATNSPVWCSMANAQGHRKPGVVNVS